MGSTWEGEPHDMNGTKKIVPKYECKKKFKKRVHDPYDPSWGDVWHYSDTWTGAHKAPRSQTPQNTQVFTRVAQ